MSYVQYPTSPRYSFGLIRSPLFSTRVQYAASGKELRATFWNDPKWGFRLNYQSLDDQISPNEYEKILGFYLLMGCPATAFLFDPNHGFSSYGTEGVFIGTGDDAETEFQLIHNWGGYYDEPCANILASPVPRIYVDGVLKSTPTHYTLNSTTGLVTFVSAPAMGKAVTADFNHQYLMRFLEGGGGSGASSDGADFEKFQWNLWRLGQVDLISTDG